MSHLQFMAILISLLVLIIAKLLHRNILLTARLREPHPHSLACWVQHKGCWYHLVINRGFDIYIDGKLASGLACPAVWSRSLTIDEIHELAHHAAHTLPDDLVKECLTFWNLNTTHKPQDTLDERQ